MDINIYGADERLPENIMNGIEDLAASCNGYDKTDLSFPSDIASLTLTASEGGELLGAVSFTSAGEDCYECSAFTYPDKRNRGIFSALLEEGISLLPEDPDILFYTDGSCPDTNAVLDALGAAPDSSEYLMEYDGINKVSRGFSGNVSPSLLVTASETGPDSDPVLLYSDSFAKLFISPRTSGSFLFDFEVIPEHRGEGHGEEFLRSVLSDLKARGLLPVSLHVSGSNEPAFNLYKKTGFRIVEALHCFIY